MAQLITNVNVIGPRFDQIVVDVGDLDGVQRVLEGLRIKQYRVFDRIEAFELVLLGVIAQTDAQVDALPDGPATRRAIEAYNAENGVDDEVTAFDVLTRLLRDRFQAAEHRDLRIGKNRDVDQFEALPHIGGGKGQPVPANAEQFGLHDTIGLGPATKDGITIGVLDSALYPSPELDERVQKADLVTDRPPLRAWQGHAAFVAGRILLRAPNANVIVRSVLDRNGMAKAWDVAYQMAALVDEGATVLNLALACYPPDGKEPFLIGRAVACLKDQALIVAAAGNHGNSPVVAITDGRDQPTVCVLTTDPKAKVYPAASDGVIAVGAASVERKDGGYALQPAGFTPKVDWVDVWAPGVDQVSTFLEGFVEARTATVRGDEATIELVDLGEFTGFASWGGSSGATGDVSGELALLAESDDLTAVRKAYDAIKGRPGIDVTDDDTDVRPGHGLADWSQADAS